MCIRDSDLYLILFQVWVSALHWVLVLHKLWGSTCCPGCMVVAAYCNLVKFREVITTYRANKLNTWSRTLMHWCMHKDRPKTRYLPRRQRHSKKSYKWSSIIITHCYSPCYDLLISVTELAISLQPTHKETLCIKYFVNWNMSKMNFSILIPLGCVGVTITPSSLQKGIFFLATWCFNSSSLSLQQQDNNDCFTATVHIRSPQLQQTSELWRLSGRCEEDYKVKAR